MVKTRRTLNSSPETLRKLKQIQGQIQAKNGEAPSLTKIMDEIVKSPAFTEVEKQILMNEKVIQEGLKIKFDRTL